MTISLALLVTATVLIAVGGVLLLTRPLTRILLGAVITSNGINLLLLAVTGLSGPARCSTRASTRPPSRTRCRRPSR